MSPSHHEQLPAPKQSPHVAFPMQGFAAAQLGAGTPGVVQRVVGTQLLAVAVSHHEHVAAVDEFTVVPKQAAHVSRPPHSFNGNEAH